MWNLKVQQTSEYNTRRSRLTDIEDTPVVTSLGVGRSRIGMGEWEVQTAACKINSRMYCKHREHNQHFVTTVNGK